MERIDVDVSNQVTALMERVGLAKRTDQLGAVAMNAAQLLMHGGFETGENGSPFEVVAKEPMYRLRRYFPDSDSTGRPAVILVPPMMFVADVYDVSSNSSAVSVLHEHGIDPWVVDFGAPEHEEGGLQRSLADHIVATSEIVDRVRDLTGRDVHLGGYSQGGVFSYSVAAYRRGAGLASVISFGSPVDTKSVGIFSLPEPVMEFAADAVAALLDRTGLPGWATREGFRLLDPVKNVRSRIQFLRQLHDREALLPNERQRRFIESEGWIAWPAPALADALRQFIAQNRMLSGGMVIDGRPVTLADVDRPVLCFVGENDQIGQPEAVRAIARAAPRADIYEVSLPVGHLGIVVGSAATTGTWPAVAAWASHLDNGTEMPEVIKPMVTEQSKVAAGSGRRNPLISAVGKRLEAGWRLGASTLDATWALTAGAATTLPRLLRLELVRPETRVSLGRLLDERAEAHPGAVGFLWEDRAHTHAALKARIDAVVAGLLSVGVRQGESVGVLMDTRPSMLIAVAALNRIGAVVVLLRPDGSLTDEIKLGRAARIVTDPEHVESVRAQTDAEVFVLGGGGGQRDLGVDGAIDLERIDPADVIPPTWYRPNPGLARETAFVLFTGDGPSTRARMITNARWARAAFGTAASAELGPRDTVFSVNPIHHPSGLLMSLGGAVASGARFSMASRFDPDTFWNEARRYGVTVVSYTWTQLRELVEAPPHPGEQHHTIRTFIGSGMPVGLWHRVIERFAPVRVVEYYASSQTDAILVNMPGIKVGCMGTPLPGSPELRIARFEERTRKLALRADGSAEQCRPREIGMLLSRVEAGMSPAARPHRGLFTPGDAWLLTGDLFYRDEDGDYWLAGSADSLVTTAHGAVGGSAVEDALGILDAIDISVTYAVPGADGDDLAVTAVTLRSERSLDAEDLSAALGQLPPDRRPHVVRIVERIPTSTSHRPMSGAFAGDGLPAPGPGVYHLDPLSGDYRTANDSHALRSR
ncbi:AMP-binding protein [Mycobacterium sp.]|uniref:AMP-binding protein n=1 Tax=Mycobacterium sp. TaxID=1785 RepID=UPI003C76BC3A